MTTSSESQDEPIAVMDELPRATLATNTSLRVFVDIDVCAKSGFLITLTNAEFIAMSAGTDLSSWFTNLPSGLIATAAVAVPEGSNYVFVRFEGRPTTVQDEKINIIIPEGSFLDYDGPLFASNKFAWFLVGEKSEWVPGYSPMHLVHSNHGEEE